MRHIAILFLLLTACPGVSAQQPHTQSGVASTDLPAFVQRIDSLRKAADIPGLSLAVLKDQEIVLAAGLGYTDVEQQIPATVETPYNIASVAKPLSAVVALRLAEAGTLELERPMADYSDWTDFCTAFRQQSSIFAKDLRCQPPSHTLRHLLSHTATRTPGTQFSYNPVLYSWASRPIMAAADTPFSLLVKRHVFIPADMRQSARTNRDLPLPKDLAERLAPPYRVDSSGVIERAPPPPPQGDGAAGGVITTVLDLAKFDVALDQGLLISAESRASMMTPAISVDGETLPYGLGWYVQEYQGHTLIWHSGWWEDAYSALYLKIPSQELTFIILANSEGIWWDNPPDRALVHHSSFARTFLSAFMSH